LFLSSSSRRSLNVGARLALHGGAGGRGTAGARLQAADLRKALQEADGAHGLRDLVAKGKLSDGVAAEAAALRGDEILGVGHLEAHGAARQAALDDEAVLLDDADGELLLVSSEAALLLEADAGSGARAEDKDLVKVEGIV